MRKGDNARARALLTEVAAAGAALDESLQAKVQDLLAKLPADDKAGAQGPGGRRRPDARPIPDAEALAAQKLNAEVGTKIAEARRLQETDPDKAIAIYEQTMKAVKAVGPLAQPVAGRWSAASKSPSSWPRRTRSPSTSRCRTRTQRAEIELKRLRILEADKAKKDAHEGADGQGPGRPMAEGNYAEAEALAKKAQEIDPNEVAATMLVFKAKTERHYKQDLENKAAKEEGAVDGLPGGRHRARSPTPRSSSTASSTPRTSRT